MTDILSPAEAQALIAKATERVFQIDYNGQTLWIKRIKGSKKKFRHNAQKLASALIPFPILKLTVSKGGETAARDEAARLRRFGENGIPCPHLLYADDTHLITTDAGIPLEHHLKTLSDKDRDDFILQAAESLATLHAKGLCHGRPYLKDFVLDNNKTIGFIDLEENPLTVMSLAEAQARDLWVFIGGITPFYPDDLTTLAHIIRYYDARVPCDYRAPLAKLLRILTPIRKLLRLMFQDDLGRDTLKAVRATEALIYYNETVMKKD